MILGSSCGISATIEVRHFSIMSEKNSAGIRPAAISNPRKRELLLGSPEFSELSSDVATELVKQMEVWAVEKGVVVVQERDLGDRVYWIDRGRAEVTTLGPNGMVKLGELHTGEMFGEVALLSRIKRRKATVVAATELVVVSLCAAAFDKVMESHPDVWQKLRDRVDSLMNIKLKRVSGGGDGAGGFGA